MKQFLKITLSILLVHLLCLGVRMQAADRAVMASGETVESVADEVTDGVESASSEVYSYPCGQSATSGIHHLSRHMRSVSSRSQLLAQENLLFVKALIGHLSRYQSQLAACANRTFTSYRLKSWNVAADCYVFGFRHILI